MWMVSSEQGLCVDPGMYVDGLCVDPGVYVDGLCVDPGPL